MTDSTVLHAKVGTMVNIIKKEVAIKFKHNLEVSCCVRVFGKVG